MHSWTNDWEKFLDNLIIAYKGKVVKIHEEAHIEFMEWLKVTKLERNVCIHQIEYREYIEISYRDKNDNFEFGQSIYEIIKESIVGGINIYSYIATHWDIRHFKLFELDTLHQQNIAIIKKEEEKRLKEIEEKLKSR